MPRPNRYFRFALETGSLPRLFDHLVGAADVNWYRFRLVYASDGGYPFNLAEAAMTDLWRLTATEVVGSYGNASSLRWN